MPWQGVPFFLKKYTYKWYIYYIYGVWSGYIHRYSRLDLGFFVLGKKIASDSNLCPRAFGPRAQIAVLGNFFTSVEKALGLGAITVYIALLDHIYTLYIYH